jgi:hypothetical protein
MPGLKSRPISEADFSAPSKAPDLLSADERPKAKALEYLEAAAARSPHLKSEMWGTRFRGEARWREETSGFFTSLRMTDVRGARNRSSERLTSAAKDALQIGHVGHG